MHNGLFGTRSLKFLCIALMLISCNPEKQWQLHEITGHLPDLMRIAAVFNGTLMTLIIMIE